MDLLMFSSSNQVPFGVLLLLCTCHSGLICLSSMPFYINIVLLISPSYFLTSKFYFVIISTIVYESFLLSFPKYFFQDLVSWVLCVNELTNQLPINHLVSKYLPSAPFPKPPGGSHWDGDQFNHSEMIYSSISQTINYFNIFYKESVWNFKKFLRKNAFCNPFQFISSPCLLLFYIYYPLLTGVLKPI